MKKLALLIIAAAPAFGAYSYVRPIVIPHTRVSADLTNFPVVIAGSFPYLAQVASGGATKTSYDIIFTSDSGCTTKLSFEQALWDPSTGNSEFHVNVPSISHTTDTTIYMCYGNAATTTNQQDVAGTWDANFQGVWHLGTGSFLVLDDSTSNANTGSTTTATEGRGQVAGSAIFNGKGGINMGGTASLETPTTALTVTAWVNPATFAQNGVSTILAQDYANPRGYPFWSYYLSANDPSCTANTFAAAWNDGTNLHVVCGASTYRLNQWYQLTFTFDGTHGTLFVNGIQVAQASGAGAIAYGSGSGFDIGSDVTNASTYQGNVDEVRVSSIVRSAAWIAAEYANQSDPGSFYTIGQVAANSGNFTKVSVVGATNTQATIRFTHTVPGSCRIAASRSPSLYPVVNDLNTTLFSGSNAANRDSANIISGNTAQIVIGKRYKAFTAADGNRYSRALKQNSQFYYAINCNGDEFDGSFKTSAIAMGDTHLDGIPADSSNPGNPAWPSPVGVQRCNAADLNCSVKRRDTEYIDPQTGLLIKHLVMPTDMTIADNNVQAPLVTGSGWTIPSGWNTSSSLNATITGSTNPLVLGDWSNNGGVGFSNAFDYGDVISGPNYIMPVMLQFSIKANVGSAGCTAGNTNADCAMQVCVTTNWQTCAANAQTYTQYLTTTATQYTFGSGQPYDVMQQTGKRLWAQTETGWRGGGVTCDGSTTVTKVWDSGTMPPDQNPVGSYIYIQAIGTHLITANIDALHFQVDTACPNSSSATGVGPANGEYYVGGSAFGILVWKETNSADTLTLTNEFINTLAGSDTDPQFNSGFYGAPMQVTLANGDPGGVLQLHQAQYSIDLLNGKVGAFMSTAPAANTSPAMQSSSFDNPGNVWTMGNDKSLTKWVYVGGFDTPTAKQNHPELPLWEWNMGSTLPTCSGTVTNDCLNSPTTITQSGQTLDVLLAAFDNRYNSNPFGLWYFTAVEMGKLYFDIRWNGSPGQNYFGWTMIFDPQATSNVYGAYGSGCVGQNTNPAGANYLTAGCIVAARRTWDAPGSRWMTQKGPGQMLRDGWVATQASIYTFCGQSTCPGGGPAVANKISGSASVPCPNGSGFSACIKFTVDGDPYDFWGGSGMRVLGTYAVGDLARLGVDDVTYPGGPVIDAPNIDLLQLVAINGTQLTFACFYGASHCPANDVNPQMLWMYTNFPGFVYPWSPMVDILAWNYVADPHGTNATGNTIIWDYSGYNAHGFDGNSIFSQGGTASPRCTANQGCYNNQNFQGLSDSAFASAMMIQSRDNVTGLVSLSSSFAGHQGYNGECGNDNCQTHPDYSKLGSDPVSNTGVDFRPFVGIGGLPNTTDISLVTGTLYKVANISSTLHLRIFDMQGTTGRRVLRNITAPGSVIASDASGYYTMCYAILANECRSGSSAGDVYVNIPYLLTYVPGAVAGSACYFPPSGFATNTSDNWSINDLCIYDAGMETQAGTRYQLSTFDMTGDTEQTFGHMFNSGRSSIFTAVHPATNITASTYPQWYYFPAQVWDGIFATMLAEAPPVVNDTAHRSTFQSVSVPVTMASGADHYGVEFGYAEYGADGQGGFECSPNRSSDPCVATTSTVDTNTPFHWESETPTGATSGVIAVPALPEHILYYRPVYYSGTTVISRGPLQTAVIK